MKIPKKQRGAHTMSSGRVFDAPVLDLVSVFDKPM